MVCATKQEKKMFITFAFSLNVMACEVSVTGTPTTPLIFEFSYEKKKIKTGVNALMVLGSFSKA